MIKRYPKEEILQEALEAVRNNFSIPIHFDVLEARLDRDLYMKADKILQMTANKKKIQFCIEIKNNITRPVIGLLVQYKEKLPHPLLLVTDYVNEYIAAHLKRHEIEFIDTAGNAFINQPPVYIFVKGNRISEKYREFSQGTAFRPTGLKVVFTFLCYPDLINKTYREIAYTAGVALGNIGWIINDLKGQGFLVDMGKRGRKLIQKEQLLNRWITEYPQKLRLKLYLGKYKGVQDLWQRMQINFKYAQWGGEVVAAKLTQYLKPFHFTIYTTPGYLNELLLVNRLKKDINGEIEILKRFWKPLKKAKFNDIVHPILVYADLMATADQRNIETAKVIFEQYIAQYIRED